jgi:hypothetical protein
MFCDSLDRKSAVTSCVIQPPSRNIINGCTITIIITIIISIKVYFNPKELENVTLSIK